MPSAIIATDRIVLVKRASLDVGNADRKLAKLTMKSASGCILVASSSVRTIGIRISLVPQKHVCIPSRVGLTITTTDGSSRRQM